MSKVAQDNGPLLAYRDELYRRLPRTPELFTATMDDLRQRLEAVADDRDLVKQFATDVRDWAALGQPQPTLAATARAIRRLADAKGPQYYTAAYWSESSHALAWRKTRADLDGATELKDLAVFLEEQAQNASSK